MQTVSGKILELLEKCVQDGWSINAIARDSGVSQSSLHRFYSKERSLKIEAVDMLCVWLGLELVESGEK